MDSSLVMALVVTTRATTGSGAVSTMSSTCLDTDCLLLRLRQRSSSTVRNLTSAMSEYANNYRLCC
jgi:hypothetical protein